MKITGYAIRAALKQHELKRDAAAKAFDGSLKAFADELGKKETPDQLVASFLEAERAIAKLQTAQSRYNQSVVVDVLGEKMTLAEAIKTVGGVARAEKMWRSATGPKQERYRASDNERDPTREMAKPTVTASHAVAQATAIGKRAGALRAAIAVGNAVAVDIEDLDSGLIE